MELLFETKANYFAELNDDWYVIEWSERRIRLKDRYRLRKYILVFEKK